MDGVDAEFAEIIAEVGSVRAGHIAATADSLAAQIRSEADALGTSSITRANRSHVPVLGSLPSQTFSQSRFWRHQFAEAAVALAGDTRRWGAPIPRCTGEEMALHLILHRAAADAGCPRGRVLDWPDGGSATTQGWGDLFEYLFEDHDVLMLHHILVEVLEAQRGVNLAPQQWFTEFATAIELPPRPGPVSANL